MRKTVNGQIFSPISYNQTSATKKSIMVAIPQQPQKMTIEEYLEWEPQQDLRYEYVKGEVFAMTGGTIPHFFHNS